MLIMEVQPVFEQDKFGNELCKEFKSHHVYKGKVIFNSEAKAWKVTLRMTAKEDKSGRYNPAFPLGPYECPNYDHWHVGHDALNVGRKPSVKVRIQLWMEKAGKKIAKIKRSVRNRIAYHMHK